MAHPDAGTAHETRIISNVSLLIASRNRPALLADTIDTICRSIMLPAELIVIDQSDAPDPTLSTRSEADGCRIRYHWTSSRGLSHANNEGIALASHEFLVFTHDDVFVAPDWLMTLVDALKSADPYTVVTGQVRLSSEEPGGFQTTLKTDTQPARYSGRVKQDVLFPLNMALPRHILATVHGFDPRLGPGTPFPAGEDNDLGYRLLESGYCIAYVPTAIIYHRAWRDERRDYLPLRWAYGVGRGAFYAKHADLGDRYMINRMLTDIRVHLAASCSRWRVSRRRSIGDLVLIAGILYGALRWVLTRGWS